MDYPAIKLCHLAGIMLLFLGLGGMAFAALAGFGDQKKKIRRAAALLHGIGLLVIIVSGFAMLSRLNLLHGDPPNWAKAKLVIFLLLGAAISPAARWPRGIWVVLAAALTLALTAAYLGLYKPF